MKEEERRRFVFLALEILQTALIGESKETNVIFFLFFSYTQSSRLLTTIHTIQYKHFIFFFCVWVIIRCNAACPFFFSSYCCLIIIKTRKRKKIRNTPHHHHSKQNRGSCSTVVVVLINSSRGDKNRKKSRRYNRI